MFLAIPLALAVSAFAQEPNSKQTVEVPDKIKGAASESLVRVVAAKGVQIYECRVKDGGTAEWAFVAPEADLFDTGGRKVGRHYAGPRWESIDGSTITGTVKDRVDAPHADAIPWLLLTARSVGPDGSFSNVTSVQRVNTVGGSAPRTVCSPAARGRVARAPYTADYYFLAPKSWRFASDSVTPRQSPRRGLKRDTTTSSDCALLRSATWNAWSRPDISPGRPTSMQSFVVPTTAPSLAPVQFGLRPARILAAGLRLARACSPRQ